MSILKYLQETLSSTYITETISDIKQTYSDSLSKFNVSEYDDSIRISLIVVNDKNQGIGTKIMQDIISYADSVGKTITLTPSSDFGGSVNRLKKFYKRFGFVENKGRNKDYEISDTMYRLPKN